MKNITLSPTKIEQFSNYVKGNEIWHTKQNFIDTIKGVYEGSYKADFGTAYHSLIEHGPEAFKFSNGCYIVKAGNSTFNIPVFIAEHAFKFRAKYPGGTYETWAFYEFNSPKHGLVKIRMRIDFIHGLNVYDFKVKGRPPKYNDFVNSFQWKIYCLVTKCLKFNYEFFIYKGDPLYGLKSMQTMSYTFYPYKGIERELESICDQLIDWCLLNDLGEYLYK